MQRTALLLRCSIEQADTIRRLAKAERRSVSGYVLNIVMKAVDVDEQLFARGIRPHSLNEVLSRRAFPGAGPRTAVLLRCATEEAGRIRIAASRGDLTISGFILLSLKHWWGMRGIVPVATSKSQTKPGATAYQALFKAR